MAILHSVSCFKCNHQWFPRFTRKPRVCPRCKSAWYDTPKKEKEGLASAAWRKVKP